jgi:TetR/AcrR family transcriptional regulator, mexJK operon transcriptional repressor
VQSAIADAVDLPHSQQMAVADDPDSPKHRAILNAATELFVARGYGAVSMDAIAREADVSKATLYAHFASKDRLFATIVQVACLENIIPADDLPNGGTTEEEALRTIGGRILRFFLRDRSLAIHRLVMAESVRFPELGHAFHENGPVASRKRLAEWMAARPGLLVPEPETAAEQFLGLLRTGVYLRATLGLPPQPDEQAISAVVTAAVRTFLRAYGIRT